MKELQQPSLWLEIMRDREKVEMEREKQLKCSTSSGSDFESHASEVQFDLDSWKHKPLSFYSRTSQLGEISTKNMPKKPTAVKVDFNVGHLCRVCLISKSIRACCDSKNSEWLFGNSLETHPQELWEVLTQTDSVSILLKTNLLVSFSFHFLWDYKVAWLSSVELFSKGLSKSPMGGPLSCGVWLLF